MRFLELNFIQNFAPSCLNRDDTNTPKDTDFGGTRRARISSQSLKRAMRYAEAFSETVSRPIASRTKRVTELLSKMLKDRGCQDDATFTVTYAFISRVFGEGNTKSLGKGGKTDVLIYIGHDEVEKMADILSAEWNVLYQEQVHVKDELARRESEKAANRDKKQKTKDAPPPTPLLDEAVKSYSKVRHNQTQAADLSLFGRMLAGKDDWRIDGACQVAHAISTHRVKMEMDYFTAVDDLQPNGEVGAGMIGITSFASACFYRYARLDLCQLLENLGGDKSLAKLAAEAFIRASFKAVPSARQNSMTAHNPPSFALAVMREDEDGWQLSNAFDRPIPLDSDNGLVTPSVKALDAYWGKIARKFGKLPDDCVVSFWLDEDDELVNLQNTLKLNYESWVKAITDVISSAVDLMNLAEG